MATGLVDIPPISCLANTQKKLFLFTYIISHLNFKLCALNNFKFPINKIKSLRDKMSEKMNMCTSVELLMMLLLIFLLNICASCLTS